MPTRPLTHLLAVFLGGVVGTALRLGLDTGIPHTDSEFPLSTLLINVGGSFLLGLLTAGLWTTGIPPIVKTAIGPGLLGSFTTFSAVILSVVLLADARPAQWETAVLYLSSTLVLGVGAALAGLALGPRTVRLVPDPPEVVE